MGKIKNLLEKFKTFSSDELEKQSKERTKRLSSKVTDAEVKELDKAVMKKITTDVVSSFKQRDLESMSSFEEFLKAVEKSKLKHNIKKYRSYYGSLWDRIMIKGNIVLN